MKDLSMASHPPAESVWLRVAGVASLASSAVAAIAVVFLTLMFLAFGLGATPAGQAFGRINDALILVAYALALPGVLATAARLRSRRPGVVAVGALVAVVAVVAVVALQWWLVTGTLTFDEQIGPVSVAFLALGAWFVLSAYLGAGLLPYGVGIAVSAALYIGYPILAFRLGRSLAGQGRWSARRSEVALPGALKDPGGGA